MKIHNLILGAFFLLIIAGNIHAASFDCGKARSEVEKLICKDLKFSKSDEDLAGLCANTLKQEADPESAQNQQQEGLLTARCRYCASVREPYATRLAQCQWVRKAESSRTPKSGQSDREACQVVADHANRGILDKLLVPPQDPTPDKKELERIFGEDDESMPNVGQSYWRIDLDNDGIPDHLVIEVQGSARVGYAYALSGKKGSVLQGFNDDGYYDLDVLRVNGRYYVLSGYSNQMGKLWRLSKGGGFVPVCEFTQRKEPMVELVAGKEHSVCSEAYLGRVRHVEYALSHTLGPLPPRNDDPIDGLAQVDIDNDGTPDNVVRVDFLRPGGRSCQGRYIAVTDDTRTNIPDTNLNELLSGKALCDSNMDVFVHEGVTYVDLQDQDGNRTIYLIKGDKAETICEFRGRLIYDVDYAVKKSKE